MTSTSIATPFAGAEHDHAACVAEALAAAETVCQARGSRLTPLRRRVLELVWNSHCPVGAYDLLDRLGEEARRPARPTDYRSLDFLTAERLVHRIDSLNAFVGCAHPGHSHRAHFLICERCGVAAELDDAPLKAAVDQAAAAAGFALASETVELRGTCPHCRAR